MRTETRAPRALTQALVAATFVIANGTSAAEPAAEHPVVRAVRACAALSKDFERLACFDRIASTVTAGTGADSAPASAEDMFGVRRQSRETRADTTPRQAPLAEITARVTALREPKDGLAVIELDNGQVWKQLDAQATLVLRAGDAVTISRGAFGTFRLLAPSGRFARVSRVR